MAHPGTCQGHSHLGAFALAVPCARNALPSRYPHGILSHLVQKHPQMSLHSLSRAAITQCCQLAGLKQQEFILSQFWSLETQNQVVRGYHLSEGSRGGPFFASSWPPVVVVHPRPSSAHVCVTPVSASVIPWPSFLYVLLVSQGILLSVGVSKFLSLSKDTTIDLEPPNLL